MGGDWDTASNWSGGVVPGAGDDVTINVAGISITHSQSNSDSFQSLTSDDPVNISNGSLLVTGNATFNSDLTLSGGTLNVGNDLQVASGGTFTLQGGTLSNATVLPGADLTGLSGTLDRVTLQNNLDVAGNSGVNISDGLTVNGTVTLGDSTGYGYLEFLDTETLGGSGTVTFGSDSGTVTFGSGGSRSALWVPTSGTTLTIGSNVTVDGQTGFIGSDPNLGGSANVNIINQGTIAADNSGGAITVSGTGNENSGSLEALNGGYLSLQGTLTNTTTVSVDGTSLLSVGGTLTGGTLTAASGGIAVGPGTLDGVTVSGSLTVTYAFVGSLAVTDGLTVNGTLTLGLPYGNDGELNFLGSQTLSGAGTVILPLFSDSAVWLNSAGTTLTIGSGITVDGQNGYLGYGPNLSNSANVEVLNEGIIQNDIPGGIFSVNAGTGALTNLGAFNAIIGEIDVSAGSFVNSGTLSVGPTGPLFITGPFTQSATGNFNVVLSGPDPDIEDQTLINGTASLDGTLNVSEANGFSQNTGDVFTVLSYTSATGQFANYTGLLVGDTAALGPAYNTGSMTVTALISTIVAPDLRVNNLALNPASPQSGQNVTVNWDDINAGNGSTDGSWTDHVVVTNTTTGQMLVTADVPYNAATRGDLAVGGSAAQSYSFQLPDGLAGAGNLLVSVTTDADDTVTEYYPGGVGYTNNTTSITATSSLSNYADLTVANIVFSYADNQISVQWEDENIGDAAVNAAFNDNVLVQRLNPDNSLTTLASGNVDVDSTLAAGDAGLEGLGLTLPDGVIFVGTFVLTVTTDSGQTVKEYDSNGNPAYGNNSDSINFSATLANYADLTVSNIAVQSPASPQSGSQVAVGWDDDNIGDADVSTSFRDSVLVQRVNPDNSLTTVAIGDLIGDTTLAAGASSPQTFSFTLPDGAAGTGNFVVTITTDSGQTVKEYDSNGNPAYGNNTNSGSFSTTLANYADLTVANVALQSPASPQSGNQVTIGWDDKDVGDGAVSSAFNDSVLVQRVNADNSLITVVSGNVSGNATLAVGGSSPQTFSFTLPDGAAGTGNFVVTVTTDSGQTVKEYDSSGNPAYGNNSGTLNFDSTIAAYPDLQVTNLAVAPTSVLQSGGMVVLDWDDVNTGNAPASQPWYDQVAVVNTTTGQTLVSTSLYVGAPINSPLAAGSSVPHSFSFQLPNRSAGVGNLAVTVTTNVDHSIFEYNASGTGFTNNTATLSATSTLAAYPDLAASDVTAPGSVVPGQQITVGWTLANNGSANANGPWTEQVLLATDAAGDNPTLLGAFSYAGPLAAGQSVSRSAMVQIPESTAGNYWLLVRENPFGEVFEANTANNTAVASQPTSIVGALTLVLANQTVSDGAGANATTATVTRNTDTSNPLLVTLTNSDSAIVSIPQTVTIPAGQTSATFAISTINPGIVVGTQTVALTASATGVATGSANLTVTDVNAATLTLALASQSIDENAGNPATTGTVTRNTSTAAPLVVSLVSNAINKLTVPMSVTIPAGQASVTFPVSVVNDNQIDGNVTVVVSAASAGFVTGSASAVVVDDNVPTLGLTLAQTTVSEAAQNPATTGTVSIGSSTSEPMTITLTSSDTTAATVPASIVIDAGQRVATFPITAVDDGLDTGDKTATITANVETDAGVILNQGSASGSLLLKEADGPALVLSFATSAVEKGAQAIATITRNTSTTDSLLVSLSSSDPTKASVPPTVTIPAGQASVSFNVAAINDHTPDGLQQVQVTASAIGLDTGLATLGIADVDLPDLVVTNVTAPTGGHDNTPLNISWTVTNSGQYPASGSWPDQVYFDPVGGPQSTTPADTVTFTGTLNPGQSYTQTDTLPAPTTVGQYTVRVVADTDQSVQELSFSNNTGIAVQPLNDQPSYQATVSTTATTVSIGTPVVLTGVATMTSNNAPAVDVPVDVGILVDGTTRTLTATTDSSGHYSVTFQPLQNEAGEYSVTASDPGVTNPAVQAQFEIVGMTASPATANVQVVPGTPLTGQFTLTDLSGAPLTGLTATTQGGPAGLTVQLTPPTQIAGNGTGALAYTITASASAVSGPVVIQVTSAEGALLDIPVNVNVVPATPVLATNPGFLNTGMVVGSQSIVTFTVVNNGGAPSGPLEVLLPATAYLSLASPATIPSLAPGASATVTLELSPPANLPLEEYQGTIAVSNATTGISVPFKLTAVSSAVGDVHVQVDDDLTFDEASAPHVQGATVSLLNPYDNTQIVATGVTDATGAVTFTNVPAGPYDLVVTASGHSSYDNSYTVVAGITNNDEVFISKQFVSYSWVVTQTTIQDTYQIQLNTTFETDVPAPVVTITAPSAIPTLQPGQSGTFNVTVTNHGLIAAQGVTLDLPSDAEYTFTALSADIGVLPAETSVVVPITVTRAAPQAVTTDIGDGIVTTKVEVPNPVESTGSSTVYVDCTNTGTVPMPAPLLVLTATQNGNQGALLTLDSTLQSTGVNTSAQPMGYAPSVEILASGATPGVLQPGESVRIPVYYAGWNASPSSELSLWSAATPVEFSLTALAADNATASDWSSMLASGRPQNIPAAAWSTIAANLASQLGTTSGGYVQLLDQEATYLGTLGENVTDVNSLWGFAVQQADNALNPLAPFVASATDDSLATPGSLSLSFSRVFSESISGRDTMSTLGMGWSTSWQTTASIAVDGTVTISEPGNAQRTFQPDSRTAGRYFSQPGDTGTLTADGSGGYLLTESDGIATDYSHNGALNYMQDTDGNRITAGYTAGQLTSLTASSGQYIHIAYNTAGLISSITDSADRTVTYNYDPSNTYLISVNGWNGQTTNYSYVTTAGAAQNALQTITIPGGTHEFFSYDSLGRLGGISQDGDAEPETFAYSLGQVTTTDGTGDASNTYYNEDGLMAKTVDALGNPTYYVYDNSFDLSKITNAAGQSETYTFNAAAEVTSSTDFLGNTTYFAYAGPFNTLSSMTDANGNTTQYKHNSSGDLLSTTYADGSSSSSTFNPEGEATSFLNQNGQPIAYAYNAAGQITQETFSDGSSYAYTYDSRGNMLTATDSTGTTAFSYDPTTGLLTEVAYPTGMYLKFTYNAAGQRTQMVDQTGFTVNYAYNADGRLSQLTDGDDNLIVTYVYDADGRLSLKTNGNGTYTTYQYDANGNVLHLINFAPDGTISSRFDYTYNALGLETTEATLDGAWTYSYDANGQLIHAVFASTNPSVPSQDLAYNYDAMGNRTSTVINGVTTAYTTNDLNEYTNVGGMGYTYDADGNLTSDGANSYSYNSLNQLIDVSGPGGATSYTYSALGERVAATANGAATQYLIDPSGLGNVVGLYSSSGSLIANYTYGLGLTSQTTTVGTYYYRFDLLGSVVDLSNSTGAVVDKYAYLPFGENLSSVQSIANPFQFVGGAGVLTDVNGLEFMRARYVDLAQGRFISQDPLGLQTPSVYSYSGNNPVSGIDPTGMFSWYGLGQVLLGTVELAAVITAEVGTGGLATFGALTGAFDGTSLILAGVQNIISGAPTNSAVNADGFAETVYGSNGLTKGLDLALGLLSLDLKPSDFEEMDRIERLATLYHYQRPFEDIAKLLPTPPGENKGGNATAGGPCTSYVAVAGFYVCGGQRVPITNITIFTVPGRPCTAQEIEAALAKIFGGVGGVGSGSTGASSGSGIGIATGGGGIPPGIVSTENCNPVINIIIEEVNETIPVPSDPPVNTFQAVTGTDEAAIAAGPPNNASPVSFIATALGNLGLINGQSGNGGLTAAELAQMSATMATFDLTEADVAGIIATAATNGGSVDIAGDVNLLQQVNTRLEAVTAAEHMLFGGDANWLDSQQPATLQQWITEFFEDAQNSSDGTISPTDRTQLLATTLPGTVSTAEANEFLDRWNRTVQYWSQGIYSAAQVSTGQSTDFLDLGAIQAAFSGALTAEQESQADGYSDPLVEMQATLSQVQSDLAGLSVCASVKLQIDQTAKLTGAAFTGTLTLTNTEGTGPMTNVVMNINITDAQGSPANGKFFIVGPNYSEGFIVSNGHATLPDGMTGTISFTFIPDNSATTGGPTLYDIGGTIGFTDPSGGNVSIPVFPAVITVYPSAQLQLNYFLQRDVIGDDPFTPQVEPSEPAVLGLLVTNVGLGAANNLSISTAQPQIVQNTKGLLSTIQITGTQVGTMQETNPSLTVDFGNVLPGQTADADFLLESSIQGIFTNFTASFTHSDELGGLDTSQIQSVTAHTLIHAGDFNFPGSTGETDYLAEDNANLGNLPDTVYLSNGTKAPVNIATNVQSSPASGALTYNVTANVTSGWDYIQLPDPGAGYTLSQVVRSDGTALPVSDMVWTTDRTFNAAGDSTVDYQLHILDLNSTGSYTVTYVPAQVMPPTSSVSPLPATSSASFPVNWSGSGGSGAISYSVYVSDNGGPFTPWLNASTQTSATYTGTSGHVYGFYSVATDSIDDVQTTPFSAQAATTVGSPLTITSLTPPAAVEGMSTGTVTLAKFSDATSNADVNDFTATIAWGDGKTSTATAANGDITANLDGTFSILGSHTYLEAASGLTLGVTIADAENSQSDSATLNVADAPLTDTTPVTTVNGAPGLANTNVVLMTFTDANPLATTGDFRISSLSWGGSVVGKVPTVSVVADPSYVGAGSGWKVVADTVTYASVGDYTPAVTVSDVGGNTVQTSNTSIDVSNPQAPEFTSANNTTFAAGSLSSFHVAAGGFPAAMLSESNSDVLPDGVKFDAATGVLSGIPAAGSAGTYTLHFTAKNGISPDAPQTFTLTVVPDVSGTWLINGKQATIQQNGSTLTFINENGLQSAGLFTPSGQVEATAWGNLIGTLSNDNTEIDWANGSVWTKAPPAIISGTWLINGKQATIQQTGSTLTFTNENGLQSAGLFTPSGQVEATAWGNLIGTLSNSNTEIDWANGTVWTKVPPPNISGMWLINGKQATIQQAGSILTFVNENGGQSAGQFTPSGQVEATAWGNLIGTLSNSNTEIDWANGSVWTKAPPAIISGTWLINGKQTTIQQTGSILTFINENGQQSAGLFTSSGQVEATAWGNLIGTLSNGNTEIDWANGTVWTKVPPPNISGTWLINGKQATVQQTGSVLTFINENGLQSAGLFTPSGQVEATAWDNLIGTLSDNNTEIDWVNGTVWVRS